MIVFNNPEHGFQIAAAIPRCFNPRYDPVISNVTPEGNLLGGVIYDGMTSNNIFMHQAGFSKRWLAGDMLWVVFDYPFNQLGVGMVCGTIPSSKPELLDFNLRLGFNVECVIKGAYKDGDLIVMAMRRHECRWLNKKPRTLQRGST